MITTEEILVGSREGLLQHFNFLVTENQLEEVYIMGGDSIQLVSIRNLAKIKGVRFCEDVKYKPCMGNTIKKQIDKSIEEHDGRLNYVLTTLCVLEPKRPKLNGFVELTLDLKTFDVKILLD